MKQQTAVEWLKNILESNYGDPDMLFISWKSFNEVFEQAKQMEKEQVIDTHYQGYRNNIGTTEISEQYYNETYGQD